MQVALAIAMVLAVTGMGLLAGRVASLHWTTAVVVPYAAAAVFLAGICYRVVRWAWTPVPFRIPTTCGQQRSLAWIRPNRLDNPASTAGAIGRMALEILFFRSLCRNNRYELHQQRLVIGESKYLWIGALAFHWSLLVILLRHLRLFAEPVPAFVLAIQRVDGFFQVGTPEWYVTDVLLGAALVYLLVRRLRDPMIRFVSLFTDYFALVLLFGIALTGILLRYFVKTDTAAVKQLALGLATFAPTVPANISGLFFAHLLLVSLLAAYFPFSKLVHMGGVFLSPTRNLANTNRMRRHINPWNYEVKTHTYSEWEEEFRDKLVAAGLPLEAESVRAATNRS